ncbi:hypothetical protein CC80DRAFT_509240 [Byssothecium circinans]|uniref:Uncharacterized protein n=1 Tax=Byssothecium circinans TaxID=147558 RepID=A0A6A5TQ97_9PLEO|nr:hypothetical protein CC80DRAFT_509240 [Byssothecium circinans]
MESVFITALPVELLIACFDAISHDYEERRRAFGALSQVCRSFRDVATPMLYTHFKSCCYQRAETFLHTISSNKQLAKYVKSFSGLKHYTWNDGEHKCPCTHRPCASEEVVGDYSHALAQAAALQIPAATLLTISDQYTTQLRETFIICRCPNIQEIEVRRHDFMFSTPLSWAVRPAAYGLVHRFKNLSKLALNVFSWKHLPSDILCPVFKLPSLRTLYIEDTSDGNAGDATWSSDANRWDLVPGSSGIRDLTIEFCDFDHRWVAAVVGTCSALRRFSWNLFPRDYHRMGGPNIYPVLFDALARHTHSLEYLRVKAERSCPDIRRAGPGNVFSLKEYTSLTAIDVPTYVFARSHRLIKDPETDARLLKLDPVIVENTWPPSINQFMFAIRPLLEGATDAFFLSIADGLSRGYFRALKSIDIIVYLDHRPMGGPLPVHFCQLKRMFKPLGVEMTFSVNIPVCAVPEGKCCCSIFTSYPPLLLGRIYIMLTLAVKDRNLFHDVCRWSSNPDDREIMQATHFRRTASCHACDVIPDEQLQTPAQSFQYMEPWRGPPEFETAQT